MEFVLSNDRVEREIQIYNRLIYLIEKEREDEENSISSVNGG